MVHGFSCHARGVEIRETGRERVRARVRSKRVHDIELRAENGRLVIACSCPARSLGVVGCQHAWAALLEIDRHGGLDALRMIPGPLEVVAAAPARERETTPETERKKAKASAEVRTASRRSPRANAAPPAPPKKRQQRRRRP
jgi:hypothetical protein